MPLCVDLCSGLGGSSQAFLDANWDVVRIDVDKRFKPTIVADVRYLPLKRDLQPDVLLASPPCTHFSLANPRFPREGVAEAMHIVGACFEAIAYLKPRFWLIENPRGRLRHLAPIKPNMTIFYSDYDANFPCQKPTDLWTNIPLPMVKAMRRPKAKNKREGWNYKMPRSPSKRSKIPLGVSQAFLIGVTNIKVESEK